MGRWFRGVNRGITVGLLHVIAAQASLWALPTIAQTYDDPAVAVCEATALRKEVEQGGYERIGANVTHLEVVITYQIQVANVAPLKLEKRCQFRPTKGGFELDFVQTAAERECVDTDVDWRMLYFSRRDLGAENQERVDICMFHIGRVEARAEEMSFSLNAFRLAALYPISPSLTALKQ